MSKRSIAASAPLSQGLRLLQRQRDKAKSLLDQAHLGGDVYAAWENTTRELLIRCFGRDSENVKSVLSIGKYGAFPLNAQEAWWEQHRRTSLAKQITMLDSCIELLAIEADEAVATVVPSEDQEKPVKSAMSPKSYGTAIEPSHINELLRNIRELQLIMVAVSTPDDTFGELSLQDVACGDDLEACYKRLYLELFVEIERLQEQGVAIENPNHFKTVPDWRLYWKKHLPSYQSRRSFVGELYQDLSNHLVDALNRQSIEQSPPETFTTDLIRRFSRSDHEILPRVSPPPAITDSLARFQQDHPDAGKTAFIMMRFSSSAFHTEIAQAIKKVLADHGITGLRADDRQYHDDLMPNIETYIYGCGFGIAVFERIEQDDFNPNVSLEVGYMLGLRKRVCLLKDKTLRILQADLVGKLYGVFDVQDIQSSIQRELTKWLNDRPSV